MDAFDVNASGWLHSNKSQAAMPRQLTLYIGLTGCFLVILAAWTVVGNTLVFIAMRKYRSLRTISNYLILNMAASDLLLAVSVLPFSITNDLLDVWVFGETLCKMWLAIDVLLCTASIWNIAAVAIDRYTATSFPMWYRERRSHVMAIVYITAVWTLSTLISVPPMLTNEHFNSTYVLTEGTDHYHCVLYDQLEYVIFSCIGSFIVPMFILFAFYSRIFCILHSKSHLLAKAAGQQTKNSRDSVSNKQSTNAISTSNYDTNEPGTLRSKATGTSSHEESLVSLIDVAPTSTPRSRVRGTRHLQQTGLFSRWPRFADSRAGSLESCDAEQPNFRNIPASINNQHKSATAQPSARILVAMVKRIKPTRRGSFKRFARREKEATKRVTVIVAVFIVSWMPFMIMYMYRGFTGKEVNVHLQKLIIWLGYANSALNPCLYIWQNRELRKAYVKILRAIKPHQNS